MYRAFAVFLALALVLNGCGEARQQTLTQDGLSMTLVTEPAPPLAGRPVWLQFELHRSDSAVDDVKITCTRGMPGMEHPGDHTPVPAQALGNGRYRAQTDFVMGGRWLVAASIQGASGQPVVMTFPVDVEQP